MVDWNPRRGTTGASSNAPFCRKSQVVQVGPSSLVLLGAWCLVPGGGAQHGAWCMVGASVLPGLGGVRSCV
eukprot:scaffold18711_cov119-Isochrysis_galbana.AAC.3